MSSKNSQDSGNSGVGYKKPPQNRQFGQKDGNKPGHGFWRKEDTLRFKLQKIAKMTAEELQGLLSSPEIGEFEKNTARTILDMSRLDAEKRWRLIEGLTNQDSGFPKQQVEQKNIEIIPILPKRKEKR